MKRIASNKYHLQIVDKVVNRITYRVAKNTNREHGKYSRAIAHVGKQKYQRLQLIKHKTWPKKQPISDRTNEQ